MPTTLNKYLDPAALDETVVNVRELIEGLEEEMQDLPYARPDGFYPDMTVGAVIGADSTAQWAQRESTGSGAATVRSVQGAAVAWNQLTAPSRFTNNASTLSTVENVTTVTSTNQNGYYFGVMLRNAAGMISGHKYLVAYDVDRSGCVDTDFGAVSVFGFTPSMSNIDSGHYWRIGTSSGANVYVNAVYNSANPHDLTGEYFTLANVMLIDLTAMFGAGNEPATVAEFEAMYPEAYYPYSDPTLKPVQIAGIASTDAQGGELDAIEWTTQTLRAAGSVRDELTSDELVTRVGVRAYQSGDENDATVRTDGTTTYYPLATPTTTPISPALNMTYRVQAGGSESIIVPAGEVSAAPVLTVAEPVNAGDEFARIWAAIQSLGYTRNAAQLSSPVSLTDIGSIDEVQKDTTEIVEIDNTKEVTE